MTHLSRESFLNRLLIGSESATLVHDKSIISFYSLIQTSFDLLLISNIINYGRWTHVTLCLYSTIEAGHDRTELKTHSGTKTCVATCIKFRKK